MTEDEHRRIIDLHRDENGDGLLIGPNCPDCQREEVVTYCCTKCDEQWEIAGKYVWSWQGKGHFHEQYDSLWDDIVFGHVDSHESSHATIVPWKMKHGEQ